MLAEKGMKPTAKQTVDALRVIRYEIEQLLGCCCVPAGDQVVRNMRLESALLHARNLIEFLTPGQERYKDSILAMDFGFAEQKPAVDREIETRLNKDLAHLTYSRLQRTAETKPWDMSKVGLPVIVSCTAFIRHVVRFPPKSAEPSELAQLADLLVVCERILSQQPTGVDPAARGAAQP